MRKLRTLVLILLALSVLVACAPADDGGGGDTGGGEEAMDTTLTIGFTASQTGAQENSSRRQVAGLNLWLEEVNAAGGVDVGGTNYTFDTVSYDDESNKERVQELYTRLATEDNADFMISPYSSGLTDAAAVIAEQYETVMLTTGAASDETYQKGYTHVFQLYTPGTRYFTAAIDQLAHLDPGATKVAIVYEAANFATSVANGLNEYALEQGYEVVLFESYAAETSDFSPFINKIDSSEPDAILGGGHFADGVALARQLDEKGVDVGYLALLVAPASPEFATELGDAANGVVYPAQWHADAAFTEAVAGEMGIPWVGPTSEEFIAAYEAANGEAPTYHSAGGYVAGLILQYAIEQAGSTDREAVKAALDNLDVMTFFGHIKFDTSDENHGLQVGHDMVYVQWQDTGAELEKVLVWPMGGLAEDALYPIP